MDMFNLCLIIPWIMIHRSWKTFQLLFYDLYKIHFTFMFTRILNYSMLNKAFSCREIVAGFTITLNKKLMQIFQSFSLF